MRDSLTRFFNRFRALITQDTRFVYYALLAVIVLCGFLIRLAVSDNPLGYEADGISHFLSAKHLLQSGTFPTVGVTNDTIPGLRNSPLELYIFMLVHVFGATPAVARILFDIEQCASIVSIYYIGRRLFGVGAGLMSAFILAFSPAQIVHSFDFIWQPYLMEPILLCGILCFVKGYQQRSASWLVGSLIIVLMATATHLSVLGILPVYVALLYITMYTLRGIRGVLMTSVVGVFVVAILFGGPISQLDVMHLNVVRHSASTEAPGIFRELIEAVALIGVWPFSSLSSVEYLNVSGVPLLLLLLAYIRSPLTLPAHKRTSLLLLGIVAELAFILVVFKITGSDYFFTPVMWALYVLGGAVGYECIRTLLKHSDFTRVATVLIVLSIFTHWLRYPIVTYALSNIASYRYPREESLDSAVNAIIDTVQREKQTHHYDNYYFFSVRVRRGIDYAAIKNAAVWDALERKMRIPFVRTFGNGDLITDIAPTSTTEIFYVCMARSPFGLHSDLDACVSAFQSSTTPYAVIDTIYSDDNINVWLAARATSTVM